MKNNEDNEMNRIKNNDYIFFVFVNMKNVSFYRVKKREERKKETYVTYIQNNNNIGYISKKINGIQWIRLGKKIINVDDGDNHFVLHFHSFSFNSNIQPLQKKQQPKKMIIFPYGG